MKAIGSSPKARTATFVCSLLLPVLFACAAITNAYAQPRGEPDAEVWVDGPLEVKPGNDPIRADAAVDYQGRKIFVWSSNGGVGREVYLRRFGPDGIPISNPSVINTYTERNQDYPRVAVAADNSFLVVWESDEPPADTPEVVRDMVRSQAYDADGQKSGGEQLLSTLETLGTGDISLNVAALRDGGYVVCWESRNTATPNYNNITIQARLVNADGTPNGAQFQVNSLYTGSVLDCDVAPLADGGFVVVWTNPEIHARRFAANGTPVGEEIQVNTIAINTPRDESAVAVSGDGRILVVWTDAEGNDTVPGTKVEVRGRVFGPTLAPLGPDFRVNAVDSGDQDWPKPAPYGDDFFVVWQSEVSSGGDIEPDSIEGRVVTGPNQFAGAQFLVNQYTAESQGFPGIGGVDGRVAIAWRSQSNGETTQNVIQGLGWYICGIFCNGFE